MNLRMTETHWRRIRRHTAISFSKDITFPPETGCILLLGYNNHPRAECLLVADILLPEDGDLKDQETGAVTFDSKFLRRALLAVRERGLKGFLTLHTHPLSSHSVGFSPFDDDQDPSLMANLCDLQPDALFGSAVLGERTIAARLWRPGKHTPEYLQELTVVGEGLAFFQLDGRMPPPPPRAVELFDRALALTGHGALARASNMRVAVVGASGTGSIMIELLMRAGVGDIVSFEFDHADHTNLNRVLHLRSKDADAGILKSLRMAEVVQESGLPTRITVIEGGDVRDDTVAQELRGCDLIIGCVDRDWPRLILSEIAYQYLIPYLDVGAEIGATETDIQSVDARVSFVGPGRPCLLCSKIITHERIRLEGLDPEEQDRVIGMGYSKDIRLSAPSVMDLNMRAASLAMFLLRHLLQPFLATPLPHTLKEAITNFNIRGIRFESAADCVVCGYPLRTGSGGVFPLTTRKIQTD